MMSPRAAAPHEVGPRRCRGEDGTELTVPSTTIDRPPAACSTDSLRRLEALRHAIEHAAHLLPSQGPITVFVHHNTLHAFEHLSFDAGVHAGGRLFGCEAYLPEDAYRQQLEQGRIRAEDLQGVLLDDLRDEADHLVAMFGTRYALRLAMLRSPLRSGPTPELRWIVAETDALRRFRPETDAAVRSRLIAETRQRVLRAVREDHLVAAKLFSDVGPQFSVSSVERWGEPTWEAFVLTGLWRTCYRGVQSADVGGFRPHATAARVRRHRELLLAATGIDTDRMVHEVLIRFCAAFLDQGFADWGLPGRNKGFYRAFLELYGRQRTAPTRFLRTLARLAAKLREEDAEPLSVIDASLADLGIPEAERAEFLTASLLALRGWAGMIWQLETNAEWAPRPAPRGSLIEFLAVRLLLDRVAIAEAAREGLQFDGPLDEVCEAAARHQSGQDIDAPGVEQRAFVVFQMAQDCGWNPLDLRNLSPLQWKTLIGEMDAFSSLERRRVFHLAFERHYRNQALDALIAHARNPRGRGDRHAVAADYQVVCCIDDREESLRRHLEEIDPHCETFGVAGFFGVAMYYRGVADAHFTPLCPVNIKPRHYVAEQPLYSFVQGERRRAEARRHIGRATHQAHRGSRKILGGLVTGFLGSLAAFPLVARVLFPRLTSRLQRLFATIVHTPATELQLERLDVEPGDQNGHLGYSVAEMAAIVEGVLRAIGLTRSEAFSPLVIFCGHGSSSLNNPHRAAYDCGACGGGRGGPNARAFAQMANDPRVRGLLAERGLQIPETTTFAGCFHNTADDSLTWYDVDRIPLRTRGGFEAAKNQMERARQRNAHERCRRFESADLALTSDDALRHVENRAEDLSQARPECGHATNALCFVGRREWSRGLFLDRRAFLASYDPAQDDERSSILERLLQAVIPVCAGINLEYYFSYVDPRGYGCDTKLPHNVTSLLGVMDGAASDLRPGLPWQMVEIHEPLRLLFVIEAQPAAIERIIRDNAAIARLVDGEWVQLAVFDPQSARVLRLVRGEFVPHEPEQLQLPAVASSSDWYAGRRDHLGFASITAASAPR